MTSQLLLAGSRSGSEDRWTLDEHDEDALTAVLRELALYTTEPGSAAVVHEREGEVISAWDRSGALRLAQLLPPSYAELAETLARRYKPNQR